MASLDAAGAAAQFGIMHSSVRCWSGSSSTSPPALASQVVVAVIAVIVGAVVVLRSVGSYAALGWDAEGVHCCGCSAVWCGGGMVLQSSRVAVSAAVALKGGRCASRLSVLLGLLVLSGLRSASW
eukprot:3942421-Pyramimonas_sp.AAC.1